MARNYADYLLFSGVLDNLPTSNALLSLLGKSVLKPMVRVVAFDCNTQLGTQIPLSPAVLGKIEVSTNFPITETRMVEMMEQGLRYAYIRQVQSCIAKNGVCQACCDASGLGKPALNSAVNVAPAKSLAFYAYLANSYSGSLVGIKPLPSEALPVRAETLVKYLSRPFLDKCILELGKFDDISEDTLTYISTIADPLEQALFILFLYGVYGSKIPT